MDLWIRRGWVLSEAGEGCLGKDLSFEGHRKKGSNNKLALALMGPLLCVHWHWKYSGGADEVGFPLAFLSVPS